MAWRARKKRREDRFSFPVSNSDLTEELRNIKHSFLHKSIGSVLIYELFFYIPMVE